MITKFDCNSKNVILASHNLTLGQFAAILSRVSLLITGDTLALHLATSHKVKIIALFGPTSATEIDLFDLGVKLVSSIDCQCCYLNDCYKSPYCMELISPELVFENVEKLLDE